ncbi:MAG TPA: hypothetical protein VGA08_02705 [Candidatus Saccharimonadales bacterium]
MFKRVIFKILAVVLLAGLFWPLSQTTLPLNATVRDRRCETMIAGNRSRLNASQIAWLEDQCEQNARAEARALPQGAFEPFLFPDKELDRYGHPLACMDLSPARFGKVDNPNVPNPNAAGGQAPINVTGQFIVAPINGKIQIFQHQVFWDIRADSTPLKIKYQLYKRAGAANEDVATLTNLVPYQIRSIWTVVPEHTLSDGFYVKNGNQDYTIGGVLVRNRSWYPDTYCHDKRAPTRIPKLLMDFAESKGWGQGFNALKSAKLIRFENSGAKTKAGDWSITKQTVSLPSEINWTGNYPWFYDNANDYQPTSDNLEPYAKPYECLIAVSGVCPQPVFPAGAVTFKGVAGDNLSLKRVMVGVKDMTHGAWLKPDGSWRAKLIRIPASLSSPAANPLYADWSLNVNLPAGVYKMIVRAEDKAGNRGNMSPVMYFTVD